MTDVKTVIARLDTEARGAPVATANVLREAMAALREQDAQLETLRTRLRTEPWCQQCGQTIRECPTCNRILTAYTANAPDTGPAVHGGDGKNGHL